MAFSTSAESPNSENNLVVIKKTAAGASFKPPVQKPANTYATPRSVHHSLNPSPANDFF